MKASIGGGDRGKTGLLSGERVGKDDLRIEAIGEVDELNSVLGVLASSLTQAQAGLGPELVSIQGELFGIGARLASSPGSAGAELLDFDLPGSARALEASMTRLEERLAPLREFILPGGHIAASWAQLARSVCRRAERRVVALAASSPGAGEYHAATMVYLNRLSDYLFILARECNRLEGQADTPWRS